MSQDEKKNKFWKCREERNEDETFLKARQNEFPHELPVDEALAKGKEKFKVSRRDFLKMMGFGVAAVSAACTRMPVKKAIPYLNKPEEIVPGKSYWYASTCSGCSASCGILVKNRDGRPIKIEGNPQSPLNQGGLCAVGQAHLLSLYDSSRLHHPVARGKKISWSEVDQSVVKKLREANAKGKKIRILTSTLTSPATQNLIGDLIQNYPTAKHVSYDAVSYSALLDAHEKAFGVRRIPHYAFDKANVLVSIAADFLGTWVSPVEFIKQYSKARKVEKNKAKMAYHVQFESRYSLTGANADDRVLTKPSEEGFIVLALIDYVSKFLGVSEVSNTQGKLNSQQEEKVKELVHKLVQNKGSSLVVSGSNDINIQLAVAYLNSLLGNYGKTLDVNYPSFQKQGSDQEFVQLMKEMESGEVDVLIHYGANPVYDGMENERYAKALKQVGFKVSLSSYEDETAKLCDVVAPDHHPLESWNDAEPVANLYHMAQPVIHPVYQTRQAQESLLKWMGRRESYSDYLKKYWQENIFSMQIRHFDFVSFWNQVVHDGFFKLGHSGFSSHPEFFPDTSFASAILSQTRKNKNAGGIEVAFYESPNLREGRLANNPWLQELPDPVTKVTWDNYISLSQKYAAQNGLKEGDVVSLRVGNESLELPVYLQPGQAFGTASVALGYGRKNAGKVGNAVGGNVYSFSRFENGERLYFVSGAQLQATGKFHQLASTQTHHSLEGRDIVRETNLKTYNDGYKEKNFHHDEMIWEAHDQAENNWGMAIDLSQCIGCSACLVGCQVENNVAVVGKEEVANRREMHWIRIDRYYKGDEENPDTVFQPMMCQHCNNAPCESVCPVLATVHSSDGLNQQVYNRCVGTRYCANNCPYKVRRFNWFDYANNDKFDYHMNDDLGKMVLNPDIVVRSRGVMEKCSMCIQRIQEGKLKAKKEGRKLKDEDIKTACQQSCPADAVVFGDLKDPKSQISRLLKKNRRKYRVLEELNVRPGITYLTKVKNRS